jgi:hypothetical protein
MKLSSSIARAARIARIASAGAAGAIAALLAACAATTPQWDAHFGDATRIALAQQVIAPAAVRNADPVAGMDGRAAAQAQQRYQKSFAEPAQSSYTVGASETK